LLRHRRTVPVDRRSVCCLIGNELKKVAAFKAVDQALFYCSSKWLNTTRKSYS
jgi:hypothetical protein